MEAKAMEAKAIEDKAMEASALEVKAMEAKAMEAKAMDRGDGGEGDGGEGDGVEGEAMDAAAMTATMVMAMAAAANTYFSSGPHDGRGPTTGCSRLLVGCVSGRAPRRRTGARVRWRSSGVRCGRLSNSRSRRANLGGRVQWCRRDEGRLHCHGRSNFFFKSSRTGALLPERLVSWWYR